MRRRLRAAFEHWRDVRALSDDAMPRERIADDALDVLVDLKGHTHGARIAILARRPAPRADPLPRDFRARSPTAPSTPGRRRHRGAAGQRRGVRRSGAAPAGLLPGERQPPTAARARRARRARTAGARARARVVQPDVQAHRAVRRGLARRAARASGRRAVAHGAASRSRGGTCARAPRRQASPPIASCSRRSCRRPSTSRGSHARTWRSTCCRTARTRRAATRCGPACRCSRAVAATFAGRVGASLCHAVELPELVAESLPDYARALQALCADRARLAHYRRHLEVGTRDAAALRHRGVHARVRTDARSMPRTAAER